MNPDFIQDGMALYSIGKGQPVFLMPYPHASSQRSTADGRLAELILSSGYRVITFDPPSFARSSRPAFSDLREMFYCTLECLRYFNIFDPLPIIGHSMGGFCALALAIEHPSLTNKLIVSGSPSGWIDVRNFSIHKKWNWREKKYWLSRYYGTRIILNRANLKIHKQLDNLFNYECFHDKSYYEELEIHSGDSKIPPPPRAIWLRNVRNYEYSERLHEIHIPVMIATGKFDPLVPVKVSEKIKNNIANSKITYFEKSGHSPFIEEKEKFSQMLIDFLGDQ